MITISTVIVTVILTIILFIAAVITLRSDTDPSRGPRNPHEKIQDKYLSIGVLFLLGTAIIGIQTFPIAEYGAETRFLRCGLVGAVFCTLVHFGFFLKWKRRAKDLWGPPLLFIVWIPIVMGNISLLNGLFDFGETNIKVGTIIGKEGRSDKKSSSSYIIVVVCNDKTYRVSVNESTFRNSDSGSAFKFVTSPGAFGFERLVTYDIILR